jgi:hypothetical protein
VRAAAFNSVSRRDALFVRKSFRCQCTAAWVTLLGGEIWLRSGVDQAAQSHFAGAIRLVCIPSAKENKMREPLFTDLILGANTIRNCDPTIYIDGIQVFRLHGYDKDGIPVVDLEVHDQVGIVAKVVDSFPVVRTREPFMMVSSPDGFRLFHPEQWEVVRVESLSPSIVRFSGIFFLNGGMVNITHGAIQVVNGSARGAHIDAGKRAVALSTRTADVGFIEPKRWLSIQAQSTNDTKTV